MEKYLTLKSDQFNTHLTADYIEFVLPDNKWLKDIIDEEELDIRELEEAGELEDQNGFSDIRLGGGLAIWLNEGLLKNGCKKVTDPVMEDYGWCFSIKHEEREFTIDIWDSLDEKYNWLIRFKEFKPFWKFAMRKDPAALERLTKIVEQLLDDSPGTNRYEWLSQNPAL